jgi:3' terminal RNA ribose 2'-O-methyltransferase Hen1
MLLTLTTTATPSGPKASDLGWLLHKNPARAQSKELSFGTAHVLWPEATAERATVALLVEVDPVALVRGHAHSAADGPLAQYVNDRPYTANSLLSVAMARLFRTAMTGTCKDRPELVDQRWTFDVELPVVPARGGEALLRRLFEPLGYTVEVERLPRDETHPDWGMSALVHLRLHGTTTLAALLRHLYVLIPVLDDDKHYWVGDDEVDKLVRRGEGWLADHPEKDAIALRYLKRRRGLARRALRQLDDEEPTPEAPVVRSVREETLEKPLSLQKRRIDQVARTLADLGARSVLDLGCGEGQLLRALLADRRFERVLGLDVSTSALERCERRLKLDDRPAHWRERLTLVQGALGWRDPRLDGFDAAAVIEVIEHMEPDRLPDFATALFGTNRPRHVLVSTPNAEYNVRFESLSAGTFRHHDHRFEWDRMTFQAWASEVAEKHGYDVTFHGIGDDDPEVGPPTQMAVFTCR